VRRGEGRKTEGKIILLYEGDWGGRALSAYYRMGKKKLKGEEF